VIFTASEVSQRCRLKISCSVHSEMTTHAKVCYRTIPCQSTTSSTPPPEPCDNALKLIWADTGFSLRPARHGIRLRECEGRPDCWVPEQCRTDADTAEPCCFAIHRCTSTNRACLNVKPCDDTSRTTTTSISINTATFETASISKTFVTVKPTRGVLTELVDASDALSSLENVKKGIVSGFEVEVPVERQLQLVYQADFDSTFQSNDEDIQRFEHLVTSTFEGAMATKVSEGSIVAVIDFATEEAASAAAAKVAACDVATCTTFSGSFFCPGTMGAPCDAAAAASQVAASTGSQSGASSTSEGNSATIAAAALGAVVAVLAVILAVVLKKQRKTESTDMHSLESGPPTLRRPEDHAGYNQADYTIASSVDEVMYDTATARREPYATREHTYETAITVARRNSSV